MCVRKYDMFDRDKKIGVFIEDWSDKVRGVQLSIRLRSDLDLSNFRYADLAVLQKNRVIDDKGVRFWIGERCIPHTRDGIEEKLEDFGLSEYNQLSIMHQTLAINLMDSVWIRFNEKANFNDNHPNGVSFKKVLPMYGE